MITDVSLDLETLGNRWNSAILSIGAVAFDRKTCKTGPHYYAEVLIDDAVRYGAVTGSTLAWWAQQGDAAKRVFGGNKKVTLYEALRGLGDFVRGLPANVCVWGNGSHFDITILEHAYDHAGNGLAEQWKFWNVRDMRTIVDAAQFDTTGHKRVGTHHNALDDAQFQAEVIAKCLMKISAALNGKQAPAVTNADEDDEL